LIEEWEEIVIDEIVVIFGVIVGSHYCDWDEKYQSREEKKE
jgi:hypothetical protein